MLQRAWVRDLACSVGPAARAGVRCRSLQHGGKRQAALDRQDAICLPSPQNPVHWAAVIQQRFVFSNWQFPRVTQSKAMPHVDDGISTFSRDVSWILRLGSGGAAAKFER